MSMNGNSVARVPRWLRGAFSRRTIIGSAALIASIFPRLGQGAQISQGTCGVVGDVCTLLHGCCEGLTCVTSRINTAFGICAAAETDATSGDTETTDMTADRAARRREKRARLAERKDRRHDALVQRRARENETRDRRRENRRNESPASDTEPTGPTNQSPDLSFKVVNPGGVSGTETLLVTNDAAYSAVLVGISSMLEYQHGDMVMLPEGSIAPLAPGDSFRFQSLPDVRGASFIGWRSDLVCSAGSADDGFVLRAAFTLNSINTDYYVLCDDPNAGQSRIR
jgi:hypothetical protein